MPTRDPAKNRVYVKKSKDRKKLEIGVEEFNKIHAGEQQKHLQKLKEEKGEEKFKEDRATYMKEFMRKKRAKEREEQKQKQIQEVQRKVSAGHFAPTLPVIRTISSSASWNVVDRYASFVSVSLRTCSPMCLFSSSVL